jgi:PAS domain S-box-containing protein
MNIYILFNIINIPIALFIGISVYSREPSNKLNRIFLSFMLIAAYTAFCEFFRLAAPDLRYAMIWHRASFLWPFFVLIQFKFVLELSGSKISDNKIFNAILYAPAFIISGLHLFTDVLYLGLVKESYGWIFIHAQNISSLFVIIFFLSYSMSSMFLIIRYYFFQKDKIAQKRIFLVIIGISIPTFTGLITNGIVRDLGYRLPPTDSFIFIISSVFLAISLNGNKTFIVDPLATVKKIFTSMKEYLLIVNNEKEIVVASDSYLNCTGLNYIDIQNNKIENFIESSDLVEKLFDGAKSGKEIEVNLIAADGSKIPVSVVISAILDPNIKEKFFLLICRDLRERRYLESELREEQKNLEKMVRKRTAELEESNMILEEEISEHKIIENALNESENKYRGIFDYAPIGIFQTKPDGKIIIANSKLASMIGYNSVEELLDVNMNEIYADAEVRKNLIHSHVDSELFQSRQVKWKKKNGSFIWVQLSSHSVKNQSGEIIYFETFVVNVSHQKIIEDELKESEERFRNLFNNSPIGIYRTMPDGKILLANHAIVKMLQFESFEELAQRNVQKEGFGKIGSREEFIKVIESNGQIFGFESTWLKKDGSPIIVKENAKCVYDDEGKIKYYEGTVEDITEQVHAIRTLKESEEKFRVLAEKSPMMIIIYQEGQVKYVNDAGTNAIGYDKEFLTSPSFDFRMLFDKDSVKRLQDSFEKHMRGEEVPIQDYSVISKSGELIDIYIRTKVIQYEGKDAVMVIVNNITERKKMENALRESEERYRNLIENINEVYFITNSKGKTTYISTNVISFTGYPVNFFIGKSSFLTTYKDDFKRVYDFYQEKMKDGTIDASIEFRAVKKDGSIYWVEQITRFIRNNNGEVIEFHSVVRDINVRKSAEEKLHLLAQAVKSSGEGISITDLENNIIFVNEAFTKIFGYNENELIGNNISIVRSNNNPEPKIDEVRVSTIRGGWSGELINKRKDGTQFPIFLSTSAVLDDNNMPYALVGVTRDITESKIAEEKVQLLAQVVKSSGEAITVTDIDDNILFINDTFTEMYGYSEDEVLGKNIGFVFSESKSNYAQEEIRLSTIGKKWSGELINRRKDGTEFPIFLSTSCVYDENGKPYALVGVARDITESKKAEGKVQLLAQAVKSSGEAITVTDLNNDLLFINDTFTEMYGYTESEVLGKNISIIHSNSNPKPVLEEIRLNTINNRWAGELINQRKDGTEFPIFLSTSCVYDENGKPYALVGVARDITERRKDEKQLEEYRNNLELLVEERTRNLDKVNTLLKEEIEKQKAAEEIIQDQLEFLQTLIDTIPSPIFIKGINKVYRGCNSAFARFHGLSKQEIIGKSIKDLSHIIPAELSIERDRELLVSLGTQKYEIVLKDFNGVDYTMLVLKAIYTKADGTVDGIVGIMLDITEIKKLENEILHSLEKEKELSKMKTRFISVASHEFRTPLTSILASADLLELYGRKWTESKYLQYVGNIQRAVEYMTELINDVLTVNREDSSRMKFIPENVNLYEFLDEIIRNIKITAGPKIKFKFDYMLKTNVFKLDKKIIKQVVTNLISNSVKYSPNGGIIKIHVCKEEDKLLVIIEDEGIGISQEDLEQLTEPFHRGKNVGSIAGTGLGLSITKRSIETHGGILAIQSELNKGTKVTVKLDFESIK